MMPRTKKIVFIGIPVAILVLGFASYAAFGRNKAPVYETIAVGLGSVVEEVTVSGQVTPAEQVDLSFERSGKVATAVGKVGDTVVPGQILVTLTSGELSAQLRQAAAGVESALASRKQYEAALLREQTQLDEARRGSRPEEITLAETKVTNARQSLMDAETNLEAVRQSTGVDLANLYDRVRNVLGDAYTKIDDAINKQIDNVFINDNTGSPQLSFTADGAQRAKAESGRGNANGVLISLGQRMITLTADTAAREAALRSTEVDLGIIRDMLADVMNAVNTAAGLSSETSASYKTSISLARANIDIALSSVAGHRQAIDSKKVANTSAVQSAESGVNTARQGLTVAEQELLLKRAGATPDQIRTREAQIKQAEANLASQNAQIKSAQATVANYQAQIEKTVLRAPINGIITKHEARVGEISPIDTPVISLISPAAFDVEVFVAEIDIVKVKVGDAAEITIDAYGDGAVFVASVTAIDPAETDVNGIATYKVTLQFAEKDERVKSGMTADITIVTEEREQVLVVPGRAIQPGAAGKTVKILETDGTVSERPVETGVRGSNGDVEILSGVAEGERVIVGETT